MNRDQFRLVAPVSTRWMDDDVYGHVNNVVYYSYFDTAVNGFLMAATGTNIRTLPAIGIVAETSCHFMREIAFPDVIQPALALEHLGRSSVIYRIALFRNEDPEPCALGRFVHVYVDAATRRPVPVPDLIRKALAGLPAADRETTDSPGGPAKPQRVIRRAGSRRPRGPRSPRAGR